MNIKRNIIFGKPQEEWRANRGECSYPYACGFSIAQSDIYLVRTFEKEE